MARTPLPAEDKHRLLRQRIPDRMFEVYCCHRVIEIAHGRSKPPPKSKSEVTLSLGDRRYGIFPPKMVSFIALDAGIMMCRALMNFLGIYFRDRPRDRLESSSEPPRDSDVYITDFGLPVLLVETACEDFRGIHPPNKKQDRQQETKRSNKPTQHKPTKYHTYAAAFRIYPIKLRPVIIWNGHLIRSIQDFGGTSQLSCRARLDGGRPTWMLRL